MAHGDYHLKELVWFRGWAPTHWLLVETTEGLTAHCTRAIDTPMMPPIRQVEEVVTHEMLLRIEKVAPGSLPAVMGFDFVLCDGLPGSAVLNRPLNLHALPSEQSEEGV